MEVITPTKHIQTICLRTPPVKLKVPPPPSPDTIRNLILLLKKKLQSLDIFIQIQLQQIATIKKVPDHYDRESVREFLLVALNIIERAERSRLKVVNKKVEEIGPIQITLITPFEVKIRFGISLTSSLSHVLSEGCMLTMSSPGVATKRAIITKFSSDGFITAADQKGRLEAGSYSIEFPYSAKVMQKKRAVVNELNPLAIFPNGPPVTSPDHKDEAQVKSLTLNDRQLHSIKVALKLQQQGSPTPFLVRGPPGTGKTTTLIELILKITEKTNKVENEETELLIIVCTPSNRAADNIIERIPVAGDLKVLRLRSEGEMSRNKENKELPGIHYSSTFTPHTVVVCTIGILHKLYDKEGLPSDSPTHLIVDEASQVADTDMILALRLLKPNCTRFIMFGDDRQLGPVVTEDELRKSPLAISMFERLLQIKSFEDNSVCLLENYRSVPGVVAPFNKLFYKNTLIAKVNKEDYPEIFALKLNIHAALVPHDSCAEPSGVYFYNVRGFCATTGDSHSWKNKKEAFVVESLFSKLLSAGVQPKDIGIITPYTDQVKLLENIVKSPAVTIGSVDSFQGQERSVIIVSTVRSTGCFGIGFVGNRKRLTVTLSRAKTALIVVGNEKILRKYSKVLRQFIDCDGMNHLN